MDQPSLTNKSWSAIVALLLLMLVTGAIAGGITLGLWHLTDVPKEIISSETSLSITKRFWLRIGLIINHLGMFLIPGLLWMYIYQKKNTLQALGNRLPDLVQVTIWSFVILASYPLIAFLAGINMEISLPEWMKTSNDSTMDLMQQLLIMDGPMELIMNLFLVGLIAAIGEELIFRGIIQRLLESKFANHHVAILLSALIFGAFHMQFERVIPLAFLGLLLGYAYYFSRSLWLVIILHLLNNSIQVILLYFTSEDEMPEIDSIPDIPIALTLGSLLLTLSLAYLAIKHTKQDVELRP